MHDCHPNFSWPIDSIWLGAPHQRVETVSACWTLCNKTALCTAMVHNVYGACYLLSHAIQSRLLRDDPVHRSTACHLRKPHTWQSLVLFLENPELKLGKLGRATGRVGRHALGKVVAALPGRHLPFDVFLLNLQQSTDRLRRMRAELKRASIGEGDYHRIPAILGTHLDMHALHLSGFVARGQHANSVGCAWSHFVVWAGIARRAVESRSVLVLEDDAILKPGFVEKASAMLRRCESMQYDICSITWYRHLTQPHCIRPLPSGDGAHGDVHGDAPAMVRLACGHEGVNTGTAAYFLSLRGARRMLDRVLPMRKNLDIQMGLASMDLKWFALKDERYAAAHDFGVKSVRVHGERAFDH